MGKSHGKNSHAPDAMLRMNFLFQASLLQIGQHHLPLASYYGQNLKAVGQKATVRVSPEVKRGLCKGCHGPLVLGVSARVRVRGPPTGKLTCIECLHCHTIKAFPMKTKSD